MEVFRLDSIIAPVHLFALVSDDLHRRGRVHPCPPQVGGRTMPEIMQPEPRHPCPTTGRGKRRSGVLLHIPLIQEQSWSVQESLLMQLSETVKHVRGHGNDSRLAVLGLA